MNVYCCSLLSTRDYVTEVSLFISSGVKIKKKHLKSAKILTGILITYNQTMKNA